MSFGSSSDEKDWRMTLVERCGTFKILADKDIDPSSEECQFFTL